jgi:hypothetical protein
VGSNKRYARDYDQLMDDRILQRVASEHPLQSLTDEEIRKDDLPITRDPRPRKCRAWVRFGPNPMRVDAVVVVWNDVACGIEFTVGDTQMRCWVWANAVTPLDAPSRPTP